MSLKTSLILSFLLHSVFVFFFLLENESSFNELKHQQISVSFFEPPRTLKEPQKRSFVPKINNHSKENIVRDLSQIDLNKNSLLLSEDEKYLLKIHSKISSQQVYPIISKKRKEEGSIKVFMELHKDGSLHDFKIIQSSQFERLNQAAVNSILKSAPFEPFPTSIQSESLNIVVPIRFQLSRID